MNDLKYTIYLQSVMGAGNRRGIKILEHYGTAEAVCRLNNTERKKSGLFTENELKRFEKLDFSLADKIFEECEKSGITLIQYGDSRYPDMLAQIDNPPLLLYVKGEIPDFDNLPSISVVGPRKVSEYGKKAAFSLGLRLAGAGMIVVSGGALGTDFSAHSGALKAGGKTVLVMGCGINSSYLSETFALRKAVTENGCLISEYPPSASATKYSFPVRNRIISALSLGTVVVEAPAKSGALITASHALEQGRDVFVIPGSPSAKEYEGSNALLRDGAKPLLDLSDIFGEYIHRFPDKIDIEKAYEKEEKKENKNLLNETLSKEAKIVYNHLDKHKFYPEEIKNTGLSSNEILSALTELEIEFLIKALPGGCYELCNR